MSRPPVTPDRYDLYERAAQSPRQQARFLRALHPQGHTAASLVLAEDFAGTGAVSRQWVALYAGSAAHCVDHDAEPLARCAGVPRLTTQRDDVMRATAPADVLCVLNFSICELHDRPALVAYLRHARARLRKGGVLALDIYGGVDAFIEGESDVELRDAEADPDAAPIRYVWEQRRADPLTGRVVNAMHFELMGGAWLRDAFVYDWRLWSVPELVDALVEAGFAAVEMYDRLGDALDEDGNVLVEPLAPGDLPDENFVLYLAARTTR